MSEKQQLIKAERPEVLEGLTWGIPTGCGILYVIINRLNGEIFEVFLKGGKSGGCMTSQMVGKLVTVHARFGIPINDEFVLKFKGTSCHNKLQKGEAQSCADAMAIAIEKDIEYFKAMEPEQLKIDNGKKEASDGG